MVIEGYCIFGAVWYCSRISNRPTPFSWGTADLCGPYFYWTVHVWVYHTTCSDLCSTSFCVAHMVHPQSTAHLQHIKPWKQFQDWQACLYLRIITVGTHVKQLFPVDSWTCGAHFCWTSPLLWLLTYPWLNSVAHYYRFQSEMGSDVRASLVNFW